MTNSKIAEQAKSSPANPQSHERRLVSEPLDMPATWEQLAGLLELIAQSAPIAVFLHDPDSNKYTLRWARDWVAQADAEASLDGDFARWLETHDQPPVRIGSQAQPPAHPLAPEGMQVPEGMEILFPLRWKLGVQEPGGWIALGPRPSDEPYSPEELRLVSALVDRAALTIESNELCGRLAELDQAKIEFMDFVAHELKQPMTSMQGYAKMLTLGIGGELNETQGQFIQVITANVDRMGRMVNNLLEISRLEAGRTTLKPERLQPKEIADQALAAILAEMEAREHSLEVDLPEDLPAIRCDRERLLQILGYLLNNACSYTPNGGTIRVSIGEPDGSAAPPGYLLFSVSDTGIGISAEDLARLDKFFRADHDLVVSQPGTGLGISIARGLIELHGGKLTIESEPDRGSTFSFTMPIAQGNEN